MNASRSSSAAGSSPAGNPAVGNPAVRNRATRARAVGHPGLGELADVFLSLETHGEMTRFLRDLCTQPELEAMAHRWQIALLLEEGISYVEIAERVPSSTATVTRVSQWLRNGTGGYRLALDRRKRPKR